MSESFICRRGGSGGGLNFNIVGGTSTPSSPKENTIWVNTSAAVSDWVFSTAQPATPTSNMVWFKTNNGGTVAFNAVKKNGIWVYPAVCKQFVAGAWIDKTAKTYQNGAWQDWYLQVINGTDISVSGGWSANQSGYTVGLQDDGLHIAGLGGGISGYVYPESFDPSLLANYNTIAMTYDLTRGSGESKINRLQIASAVTAGTTLAESGTLTNTSTSQTVKLDISNIDSGYPRLLCGQIVSFVISELRLS